MKNFLKRCEQPIIVGLFIVMVVNTVGIIGIPALAKEKSVLESLQIKKLPERLIYKEKNTALLKENSENGTGLKSGFANHDLKDDRDDSLGKRNRYIRFYKMGNANDEKGICLKKNLVGLKHHFCRSERHKIIHTAITAV